MEAGKIELPGDDIPSSPFQRFLIGFGVTFIFVLVGLHFKAKSGYYWSNFALLFSPIIITALFLGSICAGGKYAMRCVLCILEGLC